METGSFEVFINPNSTAASNTQIGNVVVNGAASAVPAPNGVREKKNGGSDAAVFGFVNGWGSGCGQPPAPSYPAKTAER